MSKGPWKGGSQSQIRRTIRGAEAAGIKIDRIDVTPEGVVSIVPKGAALPSDNDNGPGGGLEL
jgi:hypothetical protein